jgi:hypothetical protein
MENNAMSDNLTTLISKVQAILGDDGTIFSTAMCTAAIRQALSEWNMRVPTVAALTITGINNQYEYELTAEDAGAIEILDVLQRGPNNNEKDISLDYDAYVEDERIFFRLRSPVTTSNILLVRYTILQTINGLDSAVESTIPTVHNQAMIDGGAFFTIFSRAVSRVESINLSANQTANYKEMAGYFGAAFALRIAQTSKRRAPVSEPDARAWQDEYHSWNQ